MKHLIYDIFKLERLARDNENEFINLICNSLNVKGLEYSIKLIRMSGICVNRFEIKTHNNLLEKALSKVKKEYPGDPKVENLEQEINILNKLINDFYQRKKR